MTGYSPKVGDKILASREVTVGRVEDKWFTATDGAIFPPAGQWSYELVEAAPVPFEAGKPLTSAMGEPPNKSVVIDRSGDAWQRHRTDWYCAVMVSGYDWGTVQRYAPFVLTHLGGSK